MECPICFIAYEVSGNTCPLILECGHSICLSCLKQLKINSLLSCPLCKKNISSEGKAHSKNYSLIEMIEKTRPFFASTSGCDTSDAAFPETGGSTSKKRSTAEGELDIYDQELSLTSEALMSFLTMALSPKLHVVRFVIDRSKILGKYILYLEKTNMLLMTATYICNILRPSEIIISVPAGNKDDNLLLGKVVKRRKALFSSRSTWKIRQEVLSIGGGEGREGVSEFSDGSKRDNSTDMEIGRVQHNSIYGLPRQSQICFFSNVTSSATSSNSGAATTVVDTKTNFISLVNKTPTWDPRFDGYTLQFESRTNILESVKNVQLVSNIDKSIIIFQLGKLSENSFSLDCRAPLSPFAAFAAALSIIGD